MEKNDYQIVLCKNSKQELLQKLIQGAEEQNQLYMQFTGQLEAGHKKLIQCSQLNKQHLEVLTKYQHEKFG